jgi:CHAT domain-containing protein
LDGLEGARREAKSIADLLGTKALIGAEAKEDVVFHRMAKACTIHFATHGLLGDESLLTIGEHSSASVDLPPGALALTPNPSAKGFTNDVGDPLPVNGFLSGRKILLATLDADLVTLSACDTARGRTDEHQFSGLPLAFLAAGARTVVMTYWSVPDSPTADLMLLFYRELVGGKTKASALRLAMLETKRRHPRIENWAGFVLIGLPE